MKKRIMQKLALLLKLLFEIVTSTLLWRAIFVGTIAFALPQGGEVITGNATITSPTPNTVQVNQASDKAILNWQSFNIGAGEKTQFVQPNASSVALNRINPGQGASQIFGQLTANGIIILINQAGIYFNSGAHVDVSGIIASTSNISNANFLAGKYIFNEPSLFGGSIINEGSIIARNNGLVALIGTGVSNSGLIQAKLGKVVLASGNKFTIDFSGDQLINFTIDEAASQAGVDKNGQPLKNGVSNTGKIIANGGIILVTARVASGVLDNAINMAGIAIAHSVSQHNGEIILSAGEQGTVKVSGLLNVSSRKNHGGTIKVLGNDIQVTSSAVLNANGNTGGGEILIGINAQGINPHQNAHYTYIAPGADIYANALISGNGGNIIAWSNNATQVYGNISAQGGTTSGNGGFIETSGAYLDVAGININLSAPHGYLGTWLLDPENLIIQTAAATTATSSGSPINTYTSNIDTSILSVADLQNALANASVLVQTGLVGSQAGDITVANNITWDNANTLTLSAFRNINVDATITNSLGGSLALHSDNTGIGIGTITFAGATPQINMSGGGAVNFYYNPTSFPIPTNYSSNVNVNGGTIYTPYMLVNTASQLQNINNNLSGNYALGKNITLSSIFTPLGSVATPFTGQFNGLTNSINNLNITNTTPNTDLGLFGAATGATITNVNLNDVTITQTADNSGTSIYIGSLVGLMNGGSITNSSVVNPLITASGTNYGINSSRGYYDIGGLVGATFGGTVSNSFSSGGTITNNISTNAGANMIAYQEVGGLIGGAHNSAALQNVSSSTAITTTGNVTISGTNGTGELLVGGLIGRLDQLSTLLNASSSGAVTVTSTLSLPSGSGAGYVLVGGLVGITSITNASSATPPSVIDNSYSTSPVTLHATLTNSPAGTAQFLVGGLLGQSNGVLTNSHSSGPVVATFAADSTAAGNYFYAAGLAGDNFTIIKNTYSTSPVTVTGTNNGSQVEVGGLVGAHVTFYDKEITESYSSGAINVSMNNLNDGQLFVGGLIGSVIYYGSAETLWPFVNNYSTSAINVTGQNNASWTAVGGLIGANGQSAGDPGGNIKNSFSQGTVNTQITTSNGGTTEIGGFLGANIGSSAILTNNFWDTDTSGFNQNQGIGNTPGIVAGVTAGCFGGICTNGGTANLSAKTTFTNVGWDFTNNWGIIEGQSYPYLLALNPATPQAFSGTATGVINNGITLIENGGTIGLTTTGANGFFYFLQPGGITTATPLLAYLSGGSAVGNILFKTPVAGSSMSGLDLSTNAITIGGVNTSTISNTDLAAVIGNLSNTNILYSISGVSNVTLGNNINPNVNFSTTPTTTYILKGNIEGTAGDSNTIAFNGPVVLTENAMLSAANINFANTLTGTLNNLTINTTGTTTFDNAVSLANLTIAANAIDININAITTTGDQIYNGFVTLGNDATLTATQINFANGITGGRNLTLLGQPGDNSFTLLGPLTLNNVSVTGSTTGNNILSMDTGEFENWIITGANTGNSIVSGITGMFAFSNIQNLTGGNSGNTFKFNDGASINGLINGGNVSSINTLNYSSYLTSVTTTLANLLYSGATQNNLDAYITHFININNLIGSLGSALQLSNNTTTLTINSANSGFVNGPLKFNQYYSFVTTNSADSVVFVANGIFNVATNVLTVNGTPVELTGFNSNNFSGNISFINNPIPTPIPVPTTPSINSKPLIVNVMNQVNNITVPSIMSNGLGSVSITNIEAPVTFGNITFSQPRTAVSEYSLINSSLKNILPNENEVAQKMQIASPTLISPPLDGIYSQANIISVENAMTPPGVWDISMLALTITSLGFLTILATLGIFTALYRTKTIATESLARVLSKANANNYMKKSKQLNNIVAITNSDDIGNLLPGGLPEGYQIVSSPTPNDTTMICILLGPMSTSAIFTATGVVLSKNTASDHTIIAA